MNISFNLKDTKRESSPIRVIITHRGKVYRKAVGLTTRTKDWSQSKQRCLNPTIQQQLKAIRTGLEECLSELSPERAIETALNRIKDGQWIDLPFGASNAPNRPSFWGYFHEWSERDTPAKRQRGLAYRRILEMMGSNEDWEQIDEPYYIRFINLCNERGYSRNYQGTLVNKLKNVMSEGYRMKWHRNEEYKGFVRFSEPADAVYLTTDEIDALWTLDLTDGMEKRVRDSFIIGLYTGARFEDYSTFSTENIRKDGFLYYTQKKTLDNVIVPTHPRVLETLTRNGGQVRPVNQVVFNRMVKEICRKAGINEVVTIKKSKGRKTEIQTFQKWEVVSSHTARRSVVTNLAKSGASTQECMTISGHKSLQAYQRYLKQTASEVATNLAKNPYFKS